MLLEITQIFETCFDAFGIQNPVWLQLLRRIQLGFSQLNENKFKYTFRDFRNPLIAYSLELETLSHYLLRCYLFQIERAILFNDI